MLGAGCVGGLDVGGADPVAAYPPEQRAVIVETTGCGFAADRTGSGVAVGDGLVVTVAHLVVQAEGVAASVGGDGPVDGEVVALDRRLDLALLRVPPNGVPPVETAPSSVGAAGRIVGGAASGTVPFRVEQVASLSIEEVLGTARHSRLGYELAARTATGDSGAGAYDGAGRLIGIVFAISRDETATWATAGAEVADFVAGADGAAPPPRCG